jgi:hypothetical protein
MKRRTVWLAGLLLGGAVWGAETLLPVEVLTASAAVETETRIHALAQDRPGAIWGISRDKAGGIYVRGESGWNARAIIGVESLRPHAIEATPDGLFVCLWLSPDGTQGAFTRHRGDDTPTVVHFEAKLREPRLLLCADGSAIVTERGPTVVTLDAAGTAAQVRTLPGELFRPATRGDAQERNYAPTRAVQDAAGRLWLWSFALDTSDYQWRLAELVQMRRDGSFERLPIAGLAAGEKFSAILPVAPNALWVARVGEGLWSVDVEARQAAVLPATGFAEAEQKAFAYIEEMRAIGDARYVVTCPRPSEFDSVGDDAPRIAGRISLAMRSFYDQTQRTGTLFRQRDGKWQKLLDKLDEYPRFGAWNRPWLQSPDALYLGAAGSGPWILPNDAATPPVLLDWKQRFPSTDTSAFCLATNGEKLLCVSQQGETTLVPARPTQPKPLRQIEILKTWERLWRDARGHLWGCFGPLLEWDGSKWIRHGRPAEIAAEMAQDWVADDRDRGWMSFVSGRVAIFDFATAKWQIFKTVEDALQAQLPTGVQLPNRDNPFLAPVFSGDGRCALFRLPDRLSYFDSKAWRHWTTHEIADEAAQVDGAPFFDESRLCFPLGGSTRQWDSAAEKWIAFTAPLGQRPSTRPVEPSVELTQPSPIKAPASVARDADGIDWIATDDGQLKKLAPGVMVPAFFDGEPHPFRTGMKVARALIDSRGGAWLELADFGQYRRYLFIASIGLPETKAELLRTDGDTATLRFTAPIGDSTKLEGAPSTHLFSWQLDGGPWQRLTEKPDLTLTHLAAGRHRLCVRTFGPALNVDPTPAVVEWETRIDPEAQHRALLAELSAPALAQREAAAKAFRDQGAAAVPFLKAARSTASEETRWWIDAILQQLPAGR